MFDEPITLLLPSKTDSTQTVAYTVLPEQPTVEQLQTALKKLPPDCAGIAASYVCGNHDAVPQYSGSIISVSSGDEIAMNSMVVTVINIDGEGNGSGLIKIPMMNNLKFGLKLEGIKVAKGGCIVAGKAALSGVSVQLLNDELRSKLQTAYAAYNKVIDIGIANAGDIAKTINATTEAIEKLAAKITEKKRNTRTALEAYDASKLPAIVNSCVEMELQGRVLQDSLASLICQVKARKIKANLGKLEAVSAANLGFMNELEPALAECQNRPSWKPLEEKPCKGFKAYMTLRNRLKLITGSRWRLPVPRRHFKRMPVANI